MDLESRLAVASCIVAASIGVALVQAGGDGARFDFFGKKGSSSGAGNPRRAQVAAPCSTR